MKSLVPFLVLVVHFTLHAKPLDELVQQAISANAEIKYYEAELSAARSGRKAAAQLSNPELSLEAGGKNVRGLGDGPVWRAEIAQPFEFPGRVALRKAIADRDIALADLGLQQFKQLLGHAVRARAGEFVLLQRKARAALEVRTRLEELIQVLVQRDTGNVSAKLERRILEATLVTSDRALTDAEKAVAEATATLNVLCGRAPDADLKLEDWPVELPKVPSMEALKGKAALHNFELQQKRLQLARQGLQVDLTKSERWGSITFGPYIAGEQASDQQLEAGVVLSIPLPLWKKNRSNVEAEQARQQGAQAMLTATLRDLERDLGIQRAAYASELGALGHWQKETEAEFQQAAQEADHHYRLGAVPAATYVEMQRGYLDALDALIETRHNAWKHLMELERLTGTNLEVAP